MVAVGLAAVLSPEVEKIIFDSMRQADIERGIGYLDGDDVRAHLQECALAALKRFQPERGVTVTTYLWRRLHGAAVELVRVHGTRRRTGTLRPASVSLQAYLARLSHHPFEVEEQGNPDAERGLDFLADANDELADGEVAADLLLAVSRLPARMRLVLALLFYEGLSLPQAASRLRQPEETVRALRDGAVTQLRLALSPTSISPSAKTSSIRTCPVPHHPHRTEKPSP